MAGLGAKVSYPKRGMGKHRHGGLPRIRKALSRVGQRR